MDRLRAEADEECVLFILKQLVELQYINDNYVHVSLTKISLAC